jgi:Rrf2 family transcriptional regulator, nitric oxide-sensitive transcriptional repressor
MQLTLHTDYALRVLLYLAHFPDRRVHTAEISAAFGISKHHLVRVVQALAESDFVTTSTGRSGGLRLKEQPSKIKLGDVVRACEKNLFVVECFDRQENTCPIVSVCGLKEPLRKALQSFLAALDQYTLADAAQTATHTHFAKFLLPGDRR